MSAEEATETFSVEMDGTVALLRFDRPERRNLMDSATARGIAEFLRKAPRDPDIRAIVVTGAWTSGETGAVLTSMAFETAMPGVGSYVISLGLPIFAFTTMLGWAYYGERATEYWLGIRAIMPFRVLWVPFISFFFSVVLNGSITLQLRTQLHSSLGGILTGVLVLFVLLFGDSSKLGFLQGDVQDE